MVFEGDWAMNINSSLIAEEKGKALRDKSQELEAALTLLKSRKAALGYLTADIAFCEKQIERICADICGLSADRLFWIIGGHGQ